MEEKDISKADMYADILRDAAVKISGAGHTEALAEFWSEAVADLDDLAAEARHFADRFREARGEEDEDIPKLADASEYSRIDLRVIRGRGKRKWRTPRGSIDQQPRRATLTKKKGICVHHSGIFTGMRGPRRLDEDWSIIDMRGKEVSPELTSLAYRIAGQGPRYQGQSYHGWSSRLGALFFNLPFDWVTYHGDGSNEDYLGYCIDYHSGKEKLWDIEVERAKLEDFIRLATNEGHMTEGLMTIHGAWSRKEIDPGREVIEEVMIPVAAKMGLGLNLDFKASPRFVSAREMLKA